MSLITGTTTTLNGISISSGSSPAPVSVPSALIVTRAVETKEGWVGQICVGGIIIWETAPKNNSTKAETEATERVLNKIIKILE